MRHKKFMIILILLIFTIGILAGPVTASHTYHAGKYKITITDKQYHKIKKAKTGSYYGVTKKTGKYKTYKVPKYKTKKVTRYKWKYISVLDSEDWWSSDWSDYTTQDYNTYDKYTKKGWTWYGNYYTKSSDGHHTKYYNKFKKKVKVTTKKKVKVGYKTKKAPIKIEIGADAMNGAYIRVYAEWYHNGYNYKDYASKRVNI